MASFTSVFVDVTKNGTKLQTSEYQGQGKHLIVDQGQSEIAGYTDREDGLFSDVPAIIFGDHTRIVKYVDKPFFLGADGVKVLKAIPGDCDYRYLYYAVLAIRIPNTGYNRHFKWLKEADIPLPDLPTQCRIAASLDKVSEGIAVCRQMLADLDLLVKSQFVEMFGDALENDKKLPSLPGESIFKLSNGKFVPASKRKESGIPVYGGNGISWYTDEILCEEDTIVVGRVGFQSGNVHYVNGPLWVSDNAMYICKMHDSEYDLRFLYYVMEQMNFSQFQDAGDLRKVTQKPFMEKHFIKPPMEMQLQYIDFVAQADKSKFTVQQQLKELETLKKALMQEYFSEGKEN